MSSIIVFRGPGGKPVLVGGLEWRLLAAVKKTSQDAQVREAAADIAAKHAARATATEAEEIRERGKVSQVYRTKAGYFLPAEDAGLPRNAHSLASAFALWTAEHKNAVLNVRIAEEQWAVVVVIKGLPVLDKVVREAREAFELTRSYIADGEEFSVFSDDAEKYPSALDQEDLLGKIASAVDKRTAIKAVPPDLAKSALLIVLVLAAVGGFFYWKHWKEEKARLLALEQAREADPVPKYLNALAAARQQVGLDRSSIRAAVDFAMRIPTSPDGWSATRVGCTLETGCEAVFARTTGTFAGLAKTIPFLSLTPAPAINLNEARMTWQQELLPAKLDPATQLPPMTNFVQGAEASKLQDWLVAGLTLQLSPQQLWPKAPGVPDSFKHPEALATGRFDIDSIAIPQLLEAVSLAPSNVVWTGWSIELGDLKQEALSRAKARLTGNYYVTNN